MKNYVTELILVAVIVVMFIDGFADMFLHPESKSGILAVGMAAFNIYNLLAYGHYKNALDANKTLFYECENLKKEVARLEDLVDFREIEISGLESRLEEYESKETENSNE